MAMLDIREGDVLVVDGIEYPIRFAAPYEGLGLTPSFRRQLTKTASTKRAPAISAGKRGDPAIHLATLACTPLDPASQELQRTIITKKPYALKQCFAGNADGFFMLAVEDVRT